MNDLADRVLLSRSGLTRLIDRLQRDGLVAREACASDARGLFAVLTTGARPGWPRPPHLPARDQSEFLDLLGPGELRLVREMLAKPAPIRPSRRALTLLRQPLQLRAQVVAGGTSLERQPEPGDLAGQVLDVGLVALGRRRSCSYWTRSRSSCRFWASRISGAA